jgi:hypothetical protein
MSSPSQVHQSRARLFQWLETAKTCKQHQIQIRVPSTVSRVHALLRSPLQPVNSPSLLCPVFPCRKVTITGSVRTDYLRRAARVLRFESCVCIPCCCCGHRRSWHRHHKGSNVCCHRDPRSHKGNILHSCIKRHVVTLEPLQALGSARCLLKAKGYRGIRFFCG